MRSSAALIFERSRSGRRAVDLPVPDVPLEDVTALFRPHFCVGNRPLCRK